VSVCGRSRCTRGASQLSQVLGTRWLGVCCAVHVYVCAVGASSTAPSGGGAGLWGDDAVSYETEARGQFAVPEGGGRQAKAKPVGGSVVFGSDAVDFKSATHGAFGAREGLSAGTLGVTRGGTWVAWCVAEGWFGSLCIVRLSREGSRRVRGLVSLCGWVCHVWVCVCLDRASARWWARPSPGRRPRGLHVLCRGASAQCGRRGCPAPPRGGPGGRRRVHQRVLRVPRPRVHDHHLCSHPEARRCVRGPAGRERAEDVVCPRGRRGVLCVDPHGGGGSGGPATGHQVPPTASCGQRAANRSPCVTGPRALLHSRSQNEIDFGNAGFATSLAPPPSALGALIEVGHGLIC
jgi:hypothetical protein